MTESVLILDRTVDAPSAARQHVRRLAVDRTEDATLLVSELVTNAVKYGPVDGEIRLIIDQHATRTRFTVHDPGGGPLPQMRSASSPLHEGGGHGLRLVDSIADRWGVERGSTRVWFELDA
jgi:anti-sigma regulatory factor (Ser/Thr protein kinase)